jgi:hypothetical protein
MAQEPAQRAGETRIGFWYPAAVTRGSASTAAASSRGEIPVHLVDRGRVI